jgi:hypothetical protein
MARRPYGDTATVLGAALLFASCASREPPAPVPPPAPTALTVTAQRGQSQAQQNADKAQCQSQASQFARSSAEWAQSFVQCMSGRGYLVQ